MIITGSFTADAKNEAARDGTPPIDLIEGDRLCKLLRQHELGVRTRTVEDVSNDPAFLGEICRQPPGQRLLCPEYPSVADLSGDHEPEITAISEGDLTPEHA